MTPAVRKRPGHRPPDTLGRSLRLVHEDDDLMVVDKPIGMLSARLGQEGGGDSAFDLVRRHVAQTTSKPRPADRGERRREPVAWIIHRLDKDVSGLMVFAKSHRAFTALKEDLRARRMVRRYAAVVEGTMPVDPPDAPWRWIAGFLHDSGPGRRVRVLRDEVPTTDDEHAEHAVTHYRVLAVGNERSLVEARLQTGRKHQIRAHLASIGHTVVGDRLYQPGKSRGGERIRRVMLHAAELRLTHPATGQQVCWTAPPPAVFTALVGALPAAWPPTVSGPASIMPVPDKAPAGTGPRSASAAPRRPAPEREPRPDAGWDDVADWYADLVGSGASDHHEEVVLPGVLRLLAPHRGQSFLDVASGEGRLCRDLAALGVRCTGVDASAKLLAAARRGSRAIPVNDRPKFVEADARDLPGALVQGDDFQPFDLAGCVLAMMNIDPLEPVLQGVARCVKPGGRFVIVLLHPAFRSPGITAWGWERGRKGGKPVMRQYRRVDSYLSPLPRAIVMNPGRAAHGKTPITTTTWHRPLQTYVESLVHAGFVVDALEEWTSHRRSDPGPRAVEENRARREIPLFLALRAVRR
ncbi:MAG: methyltransferase domain-containing protein [Phycisphaerales bacterium]|nr:methyltransferase domain-containing protein [Phycisphaerales bacterium]